MAEEKTEEIIQHNPEKEALRDILKEVASEIQKVVDKIPNISPDEKKIKVDENYPEVQSQMSTTGYFGFWGGLVEKNHPVFSQSVNIERTLPIIKNLKIPTQIRNQGFGSKIVETWEKTFQKYGINVFAVTNIRSYYQDDQEKRAIDFWKKQGYIIPESEKRKDWPYYMIKVAQP
ncbi:hypothetical protein FJZ41_00430 [Candidatus Shapirobacteria bacterium]|nr:hypothetical protein [Candidatus Shapirobacteria bacterium]